MNRTSAHYLNVRELSKYLRISYEKALDLVNDPCFPIRISVDGKNVFSRDQVIVWIELHMNIETTDNATGNATKVIMRKNA